jgi:PT repeat
VPTAAPTEGPTVAPTDAPTDAPTEAPCVGGVAHWVYITGAGAVRPLANNTVACLAFPYNVAVVRPSCDTAAAAVRLRLVEGVSATGGGEGTGRLVHKGPAQSTSPVFLFGAATAAATSPTALPNGRYSLAATGATIAAEEWGRLRFAQRCPCPGGKKGKKGCMKKAL